MSEVEDQPWRARIRRPDGRVVGAGFLIDGRRVLTCAHVVADALHVPATGARPEGSVLVDFPTAGSAAPIPARVAEDGWIPVAGDDRGDVAVLDLVEPLPLGVEPAPLRQRAKLAGHTITTFGYPHKIEYGEWARGLVVGPGGPGGEWVQLDAATVTGRRIERGFSGAAVHDPQAGGVVGMIVAKDPEPQTGVAWMLPVEVLAFCWPPLAKLIPSWLRLDPEFRRHWQPRSRGVERHFRPGWYFTGRTRVLQELVAWLHAPPGSDPKARVVTGGPGSGKSAVLARLVTLADPTTRAELPPEVLASAAEGTMPAPGSIDVAVHAAGKTTTQIATAIADAIGITTENPNDLADELLDRGDPLTIVVDALDEGSQAEQSTRALLQPLALDGGQVGIRLLVGTRRELVGLLQAGALVIDLDQASYHDSGDLAGYVRRILVAEGLPAATTPYQRDLKVAATIAEAIAARADPSFLIAQLAARDLADRPQPLDTSRAGWQAQFPDSVAAAMDGYLARYRPDTRRVTDLLLPLAFAQGVGLADDQIWAELATALGTAAYYDYDVRGVRDTTIGTLLQVTPTEEGLAYRLFHEALAEHLRSKRSDRDAHRAYTRSLLAHTPTQAAEQPDWASASGYTRTHLAIHAAHAGQLDQLLADPAFVLHADLDRLLGVLRHAASPAGRRAAAMIQRASHHLKAGPLPERAAYLQLVARQHGDAVLAEAIDYSGLPLAWRTPWAFWQSQAPDRVMGNHRGLSTGALAVTTLSDGQPIAITGGGDGTIRLWDLATGTPRTDNLPAHHGGVDKLAVTTLPDERAIAITTGGDGTIRLWDLEQASQLTDTLSTHEPAGPHGGGVQQLAVTTLPNGQPIAISSGGDGTIRLWDLQTGTPRTDNLPAHHGGVDKLAITTLADGQPIAISGGGDGTIRLWDLQTGTPRTDPLRAHDGGVQQLTIATLPDGQPIAITGGADGTIRLWNLQTGTPRTNPLPAHQPGGPFGGVQQLAVTTLPDGPAVAITAGYDGAIRLWDLDTGAPRTDNLPAHDGMVWHLATTTLPDGQAVAITAGGDYDGTLRLWDLQTGTPRTGPIRAHDGGLWQLAIVTLPDGQPIAISAGGDGTIRLWDLATGTARTDNLPTHEGAVEQLVATTLPNGQAIALTARGERVCTHDVLTGRVWRQISVGSQVKAIALMPDGLVVVGTQMGLLGLQGMLPGNK